MQIQWTDALVQEYAAFWERKKQNYHFDAQITMRQFKGRVITGCYKDAETENIGTLTLTPEQEEEANREIEEERLRLNVYSEQP